MLCRNKEQEFEEIDLHNLYGGIWSMLESTQFCFEQKFTFYSYIAGNKNYRAYANASIDFQRLLFLFFLFSA